MARRTQTNTRRWEIDDRRRENDVRTNRTVDRSEGVRTAKGTGTARSTGHYQDTEDNPPKPQHQEDDDAKRGTTNTRKTRGKKRARGTVGGYKRPVDGGYHKKGTGPHGHDSLGGNREAIKGNLENLLNRKQDCHTELNSSRNRLKKQCVHVVLI